MFVSIRRYHTTSAKDVSRTVQEGFVPLITKSPGFIAYYAVDAGGDVWASVSIFETLEQADGSNALAAKWAAANVAPFLKEKPQITEGKLVIAEQKRLPK